jgi:hypothetical protein
MPVAHGDVPNRDQKWPVLAIFPLERRGISTVAERADPLLGPKLQCDRIVTMVIFRAGNC